MPARFFPLSSVILGTLLVTAVLAVMGVRIEGLLK